MDGKENALVPSGEGGGGSTASGPSPCCFGACGSCPGCPGCGGCPCPCGGCGCGPCGCPCGCGGCCPCPCGPCGCGCPRPGGPACPPGCGACPSCPACPGACPCPGGCPTGCPGCCPGGCPGCPGGCPGCPGMMGPMAGNNPMMAMMMMMNMQQMMAKAGGAAPQQGMNPMAGMMGMANMGGGGPAPQAAEKEKPSIHHDDDDAIDPDLRELGDYFNIEERWVVRLNEAMKKRQDTKAVDIEKLYEVLEKARSPTGLLTVQIGKMECGQFVGKIKPDKDVERLARKFKLDDPVTSRLTELKVWRKRNGEEDRATKDLPGFVVVAWSSLRGIQTRSLLHAFGKDLERIEFHLRFAKRPNALCTLLAAQHKDGTRYLHHPVVLRQPRVSGYATEVGKLLECEMDELPDLVKAEKIMTDYKLDEDGLFFALFFFSTPPVRIPHLTQPSFLGYEDEDRVIASVRKHLNSASNASSMSLGFASFRHLVGMSVGMTQSFSCTNCYFLCDCRRLSVKPVQNLEIELISDQCVLDFCPHLKIPQPTKPYFEFLASSTVAFIAPALRSKVVQNCTAVD
ncbi:unnamed protein product [Symbiodinium sp. CCMP2592]|nr:unnamed protein product [Symbiodinium sp. CCMP2592]